MFQGLKSTADEKGTAAHMAVKMDDSLGGAPMQVSFSHFILILL